MPPSDLAVKAADDLADAATRSGCRVLARGVFNDGGRDWPVLEMDCPDNATAIRFLNAAAGLDTAHPEVRDLALRLRGAHPEPLAFLQSVHAFVKASVRFIRERRETFQHALYTLKRRAGDCDDHARAVAALAMAGGARARIVGVANAKGKVGHVAALLFDGAQWRWAETTVDAAFGEAPRTAAKRLGVLRPDIWEHRRTTDGRDSRS